MPAIGFGTWLIVPNRKAKVAVLDALEAGYRLIDTAMVYGNEKGVGEAIDETHLERKSIFVTTKLWNHDQGYDKTFRAFSRSLELLGLDYVDLYLIHWPGNDKRLESWRALTEIQASGRAKAIGVSNFTIAHLIELAKLSDAIPAVNQVELHPYVYADQKDLLAYCRQQGIVVEAYSPLAHGQRFKNDPVLKSIAQKYGKSPAQVVLRWCLQHGTVPLPKSTNPEHMHDNLDVFDFELNAEEMGEINTLSDGTRTFWDPTKIR